MAGAIVSASTGAMSSLLAKLSSLIEGEYKLLKGVKREIAFMRDELSSMHTLLKKLAAKEKLDTLEKDWRDKIRELTYDIEDCIDLFMHKLGRGDAKASLVRKTAEKIKKLWSRHRIADQIQELKARVMDESERRLRYKLDESTAEVGAVEIDPRLPALFVEAHKLVGIDGPREEIIEWLMRNDDSAQQLKLVSIVGFGGLGKTTLANQVYQKVKSQFDCTAFVSVSRNPNVMKILADMCYQVGIRGDTTGDEIRLINMLREHLKEKRYFIVVDDIWSTLAWDLVVSALPENNLCSRIVTTTRNAVVAKSCCSSIEGYIHNIQPLSEQDSRKLFFKRVFHECSCPPHLEEVSHAIIRKCQGLPLAIITIASLLATRKSDAKGQWEQVHNSIGSAFTSETMGEILLLSYYDLPYHLKTCLLYLSIYPEDYRIDREELIWRWIAEGFITEVKGQTLDQVGEIYFNDLVNRSMIQPVDIQYDGRAGACRLHDMVLELIVSLSTEENFVTIVDGQGYNCSTNQIRRLSLQSGGEALQQIMNNCSQVRTLDFYRMDKETPPVSKFRSLRVLVFEGGFSNQHIKYIGSLFQLRYLRINYPLVELPDEIGDLQYLQTLDIRASRIERVPATIGRLRNLVRLLFDHSEHISDESFLRDLQALQVVEELRRLTKLRELAIGLHGSSSLGGDDTRRYDEALESSLTVLGKHGLQSLTIQCGSDSLTDKLLDLLCCTAPCLRKLVIYGVSNSRLSERVVSLVNIAHLDVPVSSIKQEDLCVLGGIPTLLYLRLRSRDSPGERLTIGSKQFQCLKEFEFLCGDCYNGGGLRMVCEQEAMPKLRRLRLQFGAKETESKMGFEHLASLEHLSVVIDCADATRREVEAAEAAIRNAESIHPGRPKLEIKRWSEDEMVKDEDDKEVRLEGGVEEEELQHEHS